jgi:hypothetical protein
MPLVTSREDANGLGTSQHDRDCGASPWLGRGVRSSWRGFAKFAVFSDCSDFNDSVNLDCIALLALTYYPDSISFGNGIREYLSRYSCLLLTIHVSFAALPVVLPSLLLSAYRVSLDWFFSPAYPFMPVTSPILHISSNAVNPDKFSCQLSVVSCFHWLRSTRDVGDRSFQLTRAVNPDKSGVWPDPLG